MEPNTVVLRAPSTMPSLIQPPSSNKLGELPLQQLWELLAPVTASPRSARASFTNWGLTYTCRPLCVFEPETEAQCELVLELARREGKKVRVAGVGHSPSDLACTSEYMLRTEKLDKVLEVSDRLRPASPSRRGPQPCPPCAEFMQSAQSVRHSEISACHRARSEDCATGSSPRHSPSQSLFSLNQPHLSILPFFRPHRAIFPPQVNREKHYVVAQAGITLNALHAALGQHGLAMKNIGSISDQTLGGVVTTATHGSGINYPVISMDVLALVLLLADGSRIRCSREENADLFLASVCGLGSTGLILEVTLDVSPAFRLKEVQESHPFGDVVRDLDVFAHAAEHVRLWWFPHAGVVRVSSSNRTHEVCSAVRLERSLVHMLELGLTTLLFISPANQYTLGCGTPSSGTILSSSCSSSHAT